MNKVYLGEHEGYHYHMADKIYNDLDWWEATALAEQLGGKLPIPSELRKFSERIIFLLKETLWEDYEFWHEVNYVDNLAYTIPLKKYSILTEFGEMGSVTHTTKGDKADTLILFKYPIEKGEDKEGYAPTHAKHFLNKALEVQDSRASEYDTNEEEERNMGKIVTAFNAITGHTLTEAEGYLFMETLKNVRLFGAPSFHEDSAVDGISYASLKAEAKAKEE